MPDGRISCEKFSVKSGVFSLCIRKLLGEKGQRKPGVINPLLQHGTNV